MKMYGTCSMHEKKVHNLSENIQRGDGLGDGMIILKWSSSTYCVST
jgi:hypothetical protein